MGLFDSVGTLLDRSILFSFDRTGYARHRASFEPGDLDVDLTGRVCLVTGANAGLGREVTAGLARLGAEVWLLCRDERRGHEAASAIAREVSGARLRVETLDVADLGAIRGFVARRAPARVDALVNNAGVLPAERRTTADGLELTLATNLAGPFLLSTLLVPRLARSDDARVVMVSSGGMYTQRLDVRALADPPMPFDGVTAYARTKRAQVALTELWAQRYADLPITWSAMHPGWADTPGVRTSLPRFRRLTQWILRTPAEGADTIVWLVACRRLKGQSGRFWFDRRPVPVHLLERTREDADERTALWHALHGWAGVAEEMADGG
jgi:NAD(P)-dependent dehydrogenase (short-subunit alcohol dehydrogenase family)